MELTRNRALSWPLVFIAIELSAALVIQGQQASGRFARSADGLTVHDDLLHVTWLADANFPAKQKFGLPIRDGGAMNFATARRWVAALNASAYLGRRNWSLPATPTTDPGCTARGPNGNSFAFNCAASAMGSLYYRGFGLRQPNTAVPMPSTRVGPFKNIQPYLYWTRSAEGRPSRGGRSVRQAQRDNGEHTFSFNTGWQGGNVSDHVMYVLPIIAGPWPGVVPAGTTDLQPSRDGQTVYDPIAGVTWLANANLAAEMTFNVAGIAADGAMTRTTADAYIAAMNNHNGKGYLGQTRWQLPVTNPDPSCSLNDFGFDCSGSPMGILYHKHLIPLLGYAPGEPLVRVPDIAIGPFHDLQPYLYWSCAGKTSQTICSSDPAAPGFEWSFSFGNGFQGTDVVGNRLYVMVYSPDAG